MQDLHSEVINSLLNDLLNQDVKFDVILNFASKLADNNFHIAGGIVRNAFTNAKNNNTDIDLFVTREGFNQLNDFISSTGTIIENPYGSIRWYPVSGRDIYYDIMIIEEWDQGLWRCENIYDVLNQFDFTANALAVDIKTLEFFNPLNGLIHARRKELRAIRYDYPEKSVSPAISLSRNSIRWFRYYYYAKKMEFSIEPITMKWIEDNAFRRVDIDLFKKYFFDPYS